MAGVFGRCLQRADWHRQPPRCRSRRRQAWTVADWGCKHEGKRFAGRIPEVNQGEKLLLAYIDANAPRCFRRRVSGLSSFAKGRYGKSQET
jgi:hypothetical protein